MTIRDEIICCSETKTKRDRCPQHLPSLPSTCVEKNLRTGLKFGFPIRPHPTSPASRKSERLTSPGRFPRCLPSRDFLTSLMEPIHTSGKERKRKACLTPVYLRAKLPRPPQFRQRDQPGGLGTPGVLCAPHTYSASAPGFPPWAGELHKIHRNRLPRMLW